MSRPITETTILYGDAVCRLEERMKENRKVSKEVHERIMENYERVKQWVDNGRLYEEHLKGLKDTNVTTKETKECSYPTVMKRNRTK